MPPPVSRTGRHSFGTAAASASRPYGPRARTTSRGMNDAVLRASAPPQVRPRGETASSNVLGSTYIFATDSAEFTKGVLEGLFDTIKSTVKLVAHDLWQLDTYRELATTLKALQLLAWDKINSSVASAEAYDARHGTHVARRQAEIIAAVNKLLLDAPRWTPRQWGYAVGVVVGNVLLAKGAGGALKVVGRVGGTATQVARANVASWELGAMSTTQAAKTVAQKLPTILTDTEGYLVMPLRIKTPINLRVQRFGQMKINGLDYWGPRIFGSSKGAARRLNAILPEWNSLTQYTQGTIPKGTNLKFGLTGSQGWRYPGGLYQVEVESKLVIEQTTKMLPK